MLQQSPPEAARLLNYLKAMLSDQHFVQRAKRLCGRKATVVINLLCKVRNCGRFTLQIRILVFSVCIAYLPILFMPQVLALGGDVLDSRCRSTAVDLLFELVSSRATLPRQVKMCLAELVQFVQSERYLFCRRSVLEACCTMM